MADSIRGLIQIRIVTAAWIRDSIRTQMTDS